MDSGGLWDTFLTPHLAQTWIRFGLFFFLDSSWTLWDLDLGLTIGPFLFGLDLGHGDWEVWTWLSLILDSVFIFDRNLILVHLRFKQIKIMFIFDDSM